jgi:ABC-type lipoprotein release transport system permease subunit
MTYAAVSGFLAMATLAASYLPARRAARIDPLIALRQD